MGTFLRVFVRFILMILASVETTQCFKDRTLPSKKIRRDFLSSNLNFYKSNNSPLDNIKFPGYQQHSYSEFKPPSMGRDEQKLAPLFSFPEGTSISIVPRVYIPISYDKLDEAEMVTSLEAAFPLSIRFTNFKLRELFPTDPFQHKFSSPDTSFDDQLHFLHDPQMAQTEKNEIDSQRPLSRKSRAVDSGSSTANTTSSDFASSLTRGSGKKCPSKSFSDRRSILQKMELFTNSFIGPVDNSKACLLRWACEIHANSHVAAYYGLIGEGALLAFSVDHLSRSCDVGGPHLEYLTPFIKAEVDGKSGNCLEYAKTCSQALFM